MQNFRGITVQGKFVRKNFKSGLMVVKVVISHVHNGTPDHAYIGKFHKEGLTIVQYLRSILNFCVNFCVSFTIHVVGML